jgi:hypothetical protein
VLHDRMFTATTDRFDVEHLVLSPRGAFLIETKRWSGVKILGASFYVGHVDQFPLFKSLVERAQLLGEALTNAAARDEEVGIVTVLPVLVVHTDELPGTPRNMLGVTVVLPPQLAPVLRSAHARWSPSAVQSLTSAAELLLVGKQSAGAEI